MKQCVVWGVVCWLWLCAAPVRAEEPRLVIDSGGHQALIWEVMFSSDGRYLISAGDDKVMRVWDVQTGATVRTIRGQIGDGHAGKIHAAALSQGDRYLAVGGWLAGKHESSRAIRIHDFQSGEVRGLLTGHTNVVYALAFSPDGRYLASGSYDRTVRLWDMEQMRPLHVLTGHTDSIFAVAFSPDGTRLVSGSNDHTLRLWDVKQGKLVITMQGHENKVRATAFSPDGRYIASGSLDNTVRLWDARTGNVVKLLGRQETTVDSLAFSPDSRWLLTGTGKGGKNTCTVFAVPSGDVITRFTQHDNIVLATAVSPDSALVATGGGNNKEIYLWNPRNGQVVKRLAGKGQPVWSVGFARDGRSMAFGNEFKTQPANNRGPLQHSVLLKQAEDYQVTLGGKVTTESDYLRELDRYGDFRLQPKQGSEWVILQVVQGEKVLYEIERDSTSGFRHRAYTFTPDGRFVASGGSGGVLTLYDRETGKEVRPLVGHTGDVLAVAVAPDNRTMVSGSYDQTVRLWDLRTGANLLTIFVGTDQEWVAWTPQGYYTSSLKGDAYIGWQLNQGEQKAAQYYSARQFQQQFYRPDVVAAYLQSGDITQAVQQANARRGQNTPRQPVTTAADLSSILPPLIHVENPELETSSVIEEMLRIKAVALSYTLPITDVQVTLNGVVLAGQSGERPKGPAHKRVVEIEAPLQPGDNRLSIVAATDKARSEPEVRTIVYTPVGGSKGADTNLPDLFLLAIGIAQYKAPGLQLQFADADARALVALLQQQEGKSFGRVKTQLLVNEEARREAILKGLAWLSNEESPRAIRLLFLSGHGDTDKHGTYFFLAQNHDPVEKDLELHNVNWSVLLRRLVGGSGRKILMVDTCRAAAVTGATGKVDFNQVLKETNPQYLGLVTFAASRGVEMAVENASWRHGAFTKALLDGLSGKADSNKNKAVDTDELGAWVAENVRALTGERQNPLYYSLPDAQPFRLSVFK